LQEASSCGERRAGWQAEIPRLLSRSALGLRLSHPTPAYRKRVSVCLYGRWDKSVYESRRHVVTVSINTCYSYRKKQERGKKRTGLKFGEQLCMQMLSDEMRRWVDSFAF